MLHQKQLMIWCIVKWLGPWCTWRIRDKIFALLWTHWASSWLIASKHILRYLKGTIDYGLKYEEDQKINLEGYVDSYWAGSAIDRKRNSGCCFSMGSSVISWFRRKQSYMALSTTESEYVVACLASCEAVWLRKILYDSFDLQLDATCIYCEY